MRLYEVSHTTSYRYSGPVATCQNQLRLTPRSTEHQQVLKHRLDITPKPAKISPTTDFFGNQVSYFELNQPHDSLKIAMTAIVRVSHPAEPRIETQCWEEIVRETRLQATTKDELATLQYTLPSPMVPHCEDAKDLANELFTHRRDMLEAVTHLNHYLHREFRYDPNATQIQTPLEDVFRMRRGVCQDLAHAMLACLRSIQLPARYVSGYLRTYPPQDPEALVGADASHAWVSVYMGQELGWVDFDPTNDLIVGGEHVTLAWGRDFRDVTPVNGLYLGAEQLSLDVAVQVKPIDSI